MNEKMIKEMAKLCCWFQNRKCIANPGIDDVCDMSCEYGQACEKLMSEGYRKLPEGSVVLSKEEYQELEELRLNHSKDLINANESYEERIADIKIEFDNHIKNLEEKIDRRDKDLNSQADRLIDLKEKLAQARKETAKEILDEIMSVGTEDEKWLKNESFVRYVKKMLNKIEEIAKQYGVEV